MAKVLFVCVAILGFCSALLADIDKNDMEELKKYIDAKRLVTVKELGGKLSISGQARAEYQIINEKKNGIKQRGDKSATGLPTNNYDIEGNIMLDYRGDRSWASLKLKYDNDAGIRHGSDNHIILDRCYFGTRLSNSSHYSTDIEIGRRGMDNIFDSKIEFYSRFDGILFRTDKPIINISDFYFQLGAFLVNEVNCWYGYVGEIGFLNIGNTGLYVKYSLIDWDTKDTGKPENMQYRFCNSQVIVGYKFMPKSLKKTVTLYAAGLANTKAKPIEITAHQKQNLAAYAGFSIGQLKQKTDWAWDASYQYVQAQAVSSFDVNGVGNGDSNGRGFYTRNEDGSGPAVTNRHEAQGYSNYKGINLVLDYMVTDNLIWSQNYQQSVTLDRKIGPYTEYKKYELELIYTF